MSFPIAPLPKPSPYELETEKQRATPGRFAVWLDNHPEPSLTALLEKFGFYGKITPHAWAEHAALLHAWRARYRAR